MNRKQRKRKLERAKAHQAQSKGLIEKAPMSIKEYNQIVKEINERYGAADPFDDKRAASKPFNVRLSWYYAAYLRLLTFWRFIRGSNSSVK